MRSHRFIVAVCITLLLPACSGDNDRPKNAPPALTNGDHVEVRENSKGVVFSLAAVDHDGDDVSFSLEGVDSRWFSLDPTSGDVRFIQPADFEAPKDEDGDNRYHLVAVAKDSRGAQATQALSIDVINVEFDYEILSPLPHTILELERYSRLPLAVWMEYDYPERLQIIANGEILNKASDSGASWTGSISMESGDDVEMLFWRGDELLDTRAIPVRHQHVISASQNLAYDAANDRVVIPHEQRLEMLVIDPVTGQSTKDYPWLEPISNISDMAFDSITGSILYAAGSIGRLDVLQGDAASISHNLDSTLPVWGLAYDPLHNNVFISRQQGGNRYVRLDLGEGFANEFEYQSQLVQRTQTTYLAHDTQNGRLFVAPSDATGVEVVDLANNSSLHAFHADWPAAGVNHRLGKIEYDAARDALFMANPASGSIVKLNATDGHFSVVSGTDFYALDAGDIGAGAPLKAPFTLALDHQRDRLLTVSASRLISINPDTGDREIIFDSTAGTGALSSGYAATWVARDGSRALAIDNELGRFFEIDLRTGFKTARRYETGVPSASAFIIADAKISSDGRYAAIHAKARGTGSYLAEGFDEAEGSHDMIKLVDLQSGASQTVFHFSHDRMFVNVNFSWPDDNLILASRSGSGETELTVLPTREVGSADTFTLFGLPATANTTLAVHQIHDQFYLLERTTNDAEQNFYQLIAIDASYRRTTLFSIPSLTDSNRADADLNTMADGALLVMLLPGESPRFWNIAEKAEAPVDLASFRGSDQPKDFYTIDDFRELLYFRANAGLHICWRLNCAILAN